MNIEVYFGVPGAGKTHALANRILELKRGKYKDKPNPIIKIVSLTNATKDAFTKRAEKLKLKVEDKNIGTLHSFCFDKLKEEYGYGGVLLNPGKWFRKKGFNYNQKEMKGEGLIDITEVESDGVFLHKLFDLLRITWDGWKDLYEHYDWFIEKYKKVLVERGISPDKFLKLFHEFMDYQEKVKKLDYTNMLYIVALKGIRLEGGDILVVDEAQDFGALHWSIVKRWMKGFEWVLVGGDDDQSIFSFAGADPSYLLELAKKGGVKVLRYSYRLPEMVVKCSNALISLNKNRYPKVIETEKEGGVVKSIAISNLKGLIKELKEKGDILILTRTRREARELSNFLYSIPHRLEIEETGDAFERLRLWKKWQKGKDLTEEEWDLFITDPKVYKAIKEKLQKRDKTDTRVRGLLEGDPKLLSKLFSVPEHIIRKWMDILENPKRWKKSNIRITTIHQAKGDEADFVIIDTSITPRIREGMKKEPETERRVWFVALTRARKEVYILNNGKLRYPIIEEINKGIKLLTDTA